LNDRIGQGDIAVKRSRAAEHTVMTNHGYFDHLASRQTDNERNDSAIGKKYPREMFASTNQHILRDKLDGLKMRPEQFEVR
jgi:hypothetical protein